MVESVSLIFETFHRISSLQSQSEILMLELMQRIHIHILALAIN